MGLIGNWENLLGSMFGTVFGNQLLIGAFIILILILIVFFLKLSFDAILVAGIPTIYLLAVQQNYVSPAVWWVALLACGLIVGLAILRVVREA